MDWPQLLRDLIIALLGAGFMSGGLAVWFRLRPENRKTQAEANKAQAEADQTDVETAQAVIAMWRELYAQLKHEVSEQGEEIKYLRAEVRSRDERQVADRKLIADQGEEISELRSQVEARDTKIAALEEKVAQLEKRRPR